MDVVNARLLQKEVCRSEPFGKTDRSGEKRRIWELVEKIEGC
jgi:hypothetical protein